MKNQKIGRRDFLKRAGLAAPVFLGNAAAIAGGGVFQNRSGSLAPQKMSFGTNLIKPGRLSFGDVVGIVAPASAPSDPAQIDNSFAALEKFGFKPKLSTNIRKRLGFLAGTDEERANDLMEMFADPEVKAIFCLRGGYGSARLLRLLDFHFIRKHPKIFIGFSDITSLHCALTTHSKLVSFHGPTLNTNLIGDNPSKFLAESLWRTVMEASPAGSIFKNCDQKEISILKGGVATGQLIGGNLSVLCAAIGTPFQPRFKNNILFLEDISEVPYRFDRMLTQLLNAGLLQQVAGVAVGINKDCEDPDAAKSKEYLQTLEDVLKDRLVPLGVPVVTGLPFGHVALNATLPVGISATLDGDNGDLIVNEAAVS